jgi:hypothetical protein
MTTTADKQNGLLDSALSEAERNFLVVPIHYVRKDRRCSCDLLYCHRPGAHPILEDWRHEASGDPTIIRQWWTQRPEANVAIRTPHWHSWLVVMVEPRRGGLETLIERAELGQPILPRTWACVGMERAHSSNR